MMDITFQNLWTLVASISYHIAGAFNAVGEYLVSTRLDRYRIEHQASHHRFDLYDSCIFCKYERDVVFPRRLAAQTTRLQSQPLGCDELDSVG